MPGGTYFLNADIESVGATAGDVAFCQEITERAGVTALPLSAFYLSAVEPDAPTGFVRFCFCKRDAVLDAASDKLKAYFAAA